MFRKFLFGLCCMALLSLASGVGPVFAKEVPPTIEKVFTPTSASGQPFSFFTLAVHEFNSSLYVAVTDYEDGGQIWRSTDGNSWQPATGHGFGINPNYTTSWSMTVFNGKLYVTANCETASSPTCPGMILRSANGQDWEQIPLATGLSNLDKLGVFGGHIFATSVNSPVGPGGQIWSSPNGDPGTWQVVQNLDPGTNSSSDMTVYQDQVYFSSSKSTDSVFIWHSADGRHWETTTLKLTDLPVGPGVDVSDNRLIVYQDSLYFGVTNSNEGGAIYHSQDGRHWDKVLSGLPLVSGAIDMIEYKGDLYAALFYHEPDWSNYGTQLWRSHSGSLGSWEQVTLNPADWGAFVGTARGAMAVFKGDLYIPNIIGSLYRINTH